MDKHDIIEKGHNAFVYDLPKFLKPVDAPYFKKNRIRCKID